MENVTESKVADYEYLRKWLSNEDIRHIRTGHNELGKIYSRRHVLDIMKGKTKNFQFRNLLIKKAMDNEALYSLKPSKQSNYGT
jgi:hypothetical protein